MPWSETLLETIAWLETDNDQLSRLKFHGFNGLALNALGQINMANKQPSTERFRPVTAAINLNHSTNYLKKRTIEQLPVILLLPLISLSLGGLLNLSFPKKVCAVGYTAIGII